MDHSAVNCTAISYDFLEQRAAAEAAAGATSIEAVSDTVTSLREIMPYDGSERGSQGDAASIEEIGSRAALCHHGGEESETNVDLIGGIGDKLDGRIGYGGGSEGMETGATAAGNDSVWVAGYPPEMVGSENAESEHGRSGSIGSEMLDNSLAEALEMESRREQASMATSDIGGGASSFAVFAADMGGEEEMTQPMSPALGTESFERTRGRTLQDAKTKNRYTKLRDLFKKSLIEFLMEAPAVQTPKRSTAPSLLDEPLLPFQAQSPTAAQAPSARPNTGQAQGNRREEDWGHYSNSAPPTVGGERRASGTALDTGVATGLVTDLVSPETSAQNSGPAAPPRPEAQQFVGCDTVDPPGYLACALLMEIELFCGLNEDQIRPKFFDLYQNLKRENNKSLRQRILTGELPLNELARMDAKDLAPDTLKRKRQEEADKYMREQVILRHDPNSQIIIKTHKGIETLPAKDYPEGSPMANASPTSSRNSSRHSSREPSPSRSHTDDKNANASGSLPSRYSSSPSAGLGGAYSGAHGDVSGDETEDRDPGSVNATNSGDSLASGKRTGSRQGRPSGTEHSSAKNGRSSGAGSLPGALQGTSLDQMRAAYFAPQIPRPWLKPGQDAQGAEPLIDDASISPRFPLWVDLGERLPDALTTLKLKTLPLDPRENNLEGTAKRLKERLEKLVKAREPEAPTGPVCRGLVTSLTQHQSRLQSARDQTATGNGLE